MRRGFVAFSALTLIGLGLTGCGLFRSEQREPWRLEAEEACLAQGLVQPSAYMSRLSAIDGPGTCGMSYPFRVSAFAEGSIGLNQRATLACPVIPRIEGWLNDVVQPAAALYFGTAVAEVKSGSYSCRSRNNQHGAKLSEHSFGNAVDVMGFRLADGREITVLKGWRGAPEEQEFLREVLVGACPYFTTVLGPGADAFHYDHLHLDLARHDPRGVRRICRPAIKFTPRLDALAGSQQVPARDARRASASGAAVDPDEDRDAAAPTRDATARATRPAPVADVPAGRGMAAGPPLAPTAPPRREPSALTHWMSQGIY